MSKDLLGNRLLFVLKTTRTTHSSLICISSGVEVGKGWHTTFSLLRPADLWPSGFVSIRAFPPRSSRYFGPSCKREVGSRCP